MKWCQRAQPHTGSQVSGTTQPSCRHENRALCVPSTFYETGRGTWKEGVETCPNRRHRPALWAGGPSSDPSLARLQRLLEGKGLRRDEPHPTDANLGSRVVSQPVRGHSQRTRPLRWTSAVHLQNPAPHCTARRSAQRYGGTESPTCPWFPGPHHSQKDKEKNQCPGLQGQEEDQDTPLRTRLRVLRGFQALTDRKPTPRAAQACLALALAHSLALQGPPYTRDRPALGS